MSGRWPGTISSRNRSSCIANATCKPAPSRGRNSNHHFRRDRLDRTGELRRQATRTNESTAALPTEKRAAVSASNKNLRQLAAQQILNQPRRPRDHAAGIRPAGDASSSASTTIGSTGLACPRTRSHSSNRSWIAVDLDTRTKPAVDLADRSDPRAPRRIGLHFNRIEGKQQLTPNDRSLASRRHRPKQHSDARRASAAPGIHQSGLP